MASTKSRSRMVAQSPEPPVPVHPFDVRHGTDTGGLIPGSRLVTGHPCDRHVTAYYGIAPSILRTLIDLWLHRAVPTASIDRYTFVDIGAGKGRAVLVAAESPFHDVVGIELNAGLARIAQHNLDRVVASQAASSQQRSDTTVPELLAPARIVHGDALALPLPETPTLLHLFHPFEAPAVRKLLRTIEAQFAARPRTLDLLYVNAEHAAVIDRHPAFERMWAGAVSMSVEDHVADLREIANQAEYGSTGDEQCAIYRYVGRNR